MEYLYLCRMREVGYFCQSMWETRYEHMVTVSSAQFMVFAVLLLALAFIKQRSITAGAPFWIGGELPVFVVRPHAPNREVLTMTVRYKYMYRATPYIYIYIYTYTYTYIYIYIYIIMVFCCLSGFHKTNYFLINISQNLIQCQKPNQKAFI